MSIELQLRKARRFQKSGQFDEARAALGAVLAAYPNNARTRAAIAELKRHEQQRNEPPAAIREALSAALARGEDAQVLRVAKDTLARFPKSGLLWRSFGTACTRLGDAETAASCFQTALGLDPDDACAYAGLGDARKALDQLEGAAACYQLALERDPEHLRALTALAATYHRLGCPGEAAQTLGRAVACAPDNQQIARLHAHALTAADQLDAAAERFRDIVARWPGSGADLCALGHVETQRKDYAAASAAFDAAVALDPGNEAAMADAILCRSVLNDWSQWDRAVATVETHDWRGPKVDPAFMLRLVDSPQLQCRQSVRYAARFAAADRPALPRPAQRPERLRIGYFSADFHNHATLLLMNGLFEQHDRSRFEIAAYSFGPDSAHQSRQRLLRNVDAFHEVRGLDDDAIVALARGHGLDIAVDLKGYTDEARPGIFARRVAPLQIAYLGYPGTMGHPAIDYAVVDRIVLPPEHRDSFTERLITMPDSYQVNDDTRPLPDAPETRAAYGLPDDAFVFCCFNNTYKITPREFDIWMRLLARVEGSVLWLMRENEGSVANLRAEAVARGIDPGRLIFADRTTVPEHIARHAQADLFLDTFNVNAHTTCSDALWAGLPVITCAGRQFAARVGASLLTAAGVPELVTATAADYEALALALAGDRERLAGYRRRLIEGRTQAPLFDTARFTTGLEWAYDAVHARYRRGEDPVDIAVPQ